MELALALALALRLPVLQSALPPVLQSPLRLRLAPLRPLLLR